jgi:hypothetical protein
MPSVILLTLTLHSPVSRSETEPAANPPVCPEGKRYHEPLGECILAIPECGPKEYLDQLSLTCVPKPLTKRDCQAQGLRFDAQRKVCLPKTFRNYCEDSEQPYDFVRTVSCILNHMEAYSCRTAEETLRQTKSFQLRDGQFKIGSLEPFVHLPFLEELALEHQALTDITPLAELTQLRSLSLAHNDISDLSALTKLTQLEFLNLTGNPIDSFKALKDLPALQVLVIERDKLPLLPPNRNFEIQIAPE